MGDLLKNRNLGHSQYNLVIGLVMFGGVSLAAILALLFRGIFANWHPVLLIIIYLIISLIGAGIAKKSEMPAMSLLGFNLVVAPAGMILAAILPGKASSTVVNALLLTIGVVIVMAIAGYLRPKLFLKLGNVLLLALVAVVVVEVLGMIFCHATWDWWQVIVAGIFALLIGYDWARAQSRELTTDGAIDACVDLFIDGFNLFLRLLSFIKD